MKLKETQKALESLDKTIEAMKKAEYYEVAQDLEFLYDEINSDLCEAIDMVNDIKEEQEKGVDND